MKNKAVYILILANLFIIFTMFTININKKLDTNTIISYNTDLKAIKKVTSVSTELNDIPIEDIVVMVDDNSEYSPEISINFPINLNTATKEQLMALPNIGEVKSGNIIDYRNQLGGYTDIEQLLDVKGIGEKTFAEIAEYLYID